MAMKRKGNVRTDKPSVVMLQSRNYAPDVQMVRIRRQGRAMTELGYDVTVLCWARRRGFPPQQVAKEGFTVRRIYVPSDYGRFMIYLMTLPIFQIRAFFHLLRHDYDIISAHDFDTLLPSVAAGRLKGRPVVYDVHDQFTKHPGLLGIPFGGLISHLIGAMERRLIRSCRAVIACGRGMYDEYKELDITDVVFIPTSPSLDFVPGEKAATFPDDSFVITYMGTVREVEGFRALIRGCGEAQKAVSKGKPVTVEIVGGGKTSITFDTVRKEAEGSDVTVRLLDWIPYDELPDHYINASMVFAMYDPADRNAAGTIAVKYMEAMAAGKPVLATKGTLMGDMAEDLGIGYAVPYADAKGIAEAVKDALDNPKKLREMGRRARAEFEKEWAWEIMVKRLDEVYTKVVREDDNH